MSRDLLARIQAAIDVAHAAFGAPGDHGYDTREGQALFQLYSLRPDVVRALRERSDPASGRPSE